MATATSGGGTTPPPSNTNPSMSGPTGAAIKWVLRILLIFALLLLMKNGCNKKDEAEDVIKKTIPCNILRNELVVSGRDAWTTFDYDFSIETQGDSLWFQFPSARHKGEMLDSILWTGKGTLSLKEERDFGPVKVWPPNPAKMVWLKISEVRMCEE